jgi:hypothetical protein
MSDQSLNLIAKMAQLMPDLSRERKQFWIERPSQLRNFLGAMSASEQLPAVYEIPTTIELKGETFDPFVFLLRDKRVCIREKLNDVLSFWPETLVSGMRQRIRYSHTKKAAVNKAVRRDLPERHVFEWRSVDLFYTAAEMLKYHFDYGHAMGLTPTAPNLLYENSDTDGISILVIEKGKLSDDPWQLKILPYDDTKTVWPGGTRVFFPNCAE